jgi:hypothetical protein
MFLNFAKKKPRMKKHCWLFTFSTSSLIHRQIIYGKMQHLITRGDAYWAMHPRIHFIKNLEGTCPNIQGRGGTTNESEQ